LEREDTSYVKVIVNKNDDNRVIGFHILSPNAGEITQGISVAINCGLTKEQLDNTVGIHPTVAEECTLLTSILGESEGDKEDC
jgi:pyruvate/2-oxoglutarate dehydrogenase complex dihydrolipoamide dehydrogenase (E3) component